MLTRPIPQTLPRPLGGFFVGGGYDAATEAFIATSGVVNQALTDPLNALVIALKATDAWSRAIAIYPMIGGNAFSHSINLVNPLNSDLGKRIVWGGTWSHDWSGALPDGSTAFADTKINPSEDMPQYSITGSVYTSSTHTTSTGMSLYGIVGGSNANCQLLFTSTSVVYAAAGRDAVSTNITITGQTQFNGLWTASAYHTNNFTLYRNATQLGTRTTPVRLGYLPDQDVARRRTIYLAADNDGATGRKSSYKQCYAYFGCGLDASTVSAMNTAVQAYQLALGRA